MKDIDSLNLPDDVRYSQSHEWARMAEDKVKTGISDYAQDQLGDIVFVEMPKIGDIIKKGDVFGTIESVKAVSELYMPVSGEILSINMELANHPELVNQNPYDKGWMLEIKPANPAEMDTLMTKNDYIAMLKG